MLMSNRVKDIIQIVLSSRGFVTMKATANKMNVSERTVYREIPEVTEVLRQYQITLKTVSKKGIRAVGLPEHIQKLQTELGEHKKLQVVDPKERMYFVLLELLHQDDFMKTEALAIDMGTSLPTIRNDLKKIEKILPEYNIKLISKKGDGICLGGEQVARDHLMVNIIMKNTDMDVIVHWLAGNVRQFHPFMQKLDEYGYMELFQTCEKILKDISHKLIQKNYQILDQNYAELVMLVSLLIRRHKIGNRKYSTDFTVEHVDKNLKKLVAALIRMLEKKYSISLGEAEKEYLLWVMDISVGKRNNENVFVKNFVLKPKIEEFVELVERRMGINLSQDTKLMDGLLTHIDKALVRTRSGMSISNPIIRDIEKDYSQLFSIIKDTVRKVFPDDYFPDDEIGYLVLYFAVSLDNITKKTFRVLVVCSSGMGSSKMLASRLEREIPEIYVRKIVSLVGLGEEDLNDYDLILSTIPLYLKDREYLKVSPLLNDNELEIVKEKIRRHKHQTLRKIEEQERKAAELESSNSIVSLKQLKQLTTWAVDLLTEFHVYEINNLKDENHLFSNLEHTIWEAGIFIGEQEIKNYVIRHATECRFTIPTTEISYFECYLEKIKKPLFFVYHLKEKRMVDPQEGDAISNIIFFFYPTEMDEVQQMFLRYITELIIEDRDVMKLIEKGDEEEIRQCFGHRFRHYIGESI